mmetsp:Transcript_6961/g.8382  ORF Transcript_6961/g.8382 Transcript_6961/m.8382 type:complete len:101 (-) Transcript_6961:50-352(-)
MNKYNQAVKDDKFHEDRFRGYHRYDCLQLANVNKVTQAMSREQWVVFGNFNCPSTHVSYQKRVGSAKTKYIDERWNSCDKETDETLYFADGTAALNRLNK